MLLYMTEFHLAEQLKYYLTFKLQRWESWSKGLMITLQEPYKFYYYFSAKFEVRILWKVLPVERKNFLWSEKALARNLTLTSLYCARVNFENIWLKKKAAHGLTFFGYGKFLSALNMFLWLESRVSKINHVDSKTIKKKKLRYRNLKCLKIESE